jgi:hypothetical protein
MPATVDQALQIVITVFEAEAQEKRICHFFRILKAIERVETSLFTPERCLEHQSIDRLLVLAQTSRT